MVQRGHEDGTQFEVFAAGVLDDAQPVFGLPGLDGEFVEGFLEAADAIDRTFPTHNFTDGGLGAREVAVRYSHTDLNDDTVSGGRLNDITGGVNWYLNPNAKIQFNYVNAMVDRGTTDGTAHVFQSRFAVDF